MIAARWRQAIGWTAVVVSTTYASLWALWGSIENFYEGWYYREWWRNLALALIQYWPWMLVLMLAALAALWRRWLGVVVHAALAGLLLWRFGVHPSAAVTLLVAPLGLLAIAYAVGTARPTYWARRLVVIVPLLTFLIAGAYPGWRVFTRPAEVDLTMRGIEGAGVELTWAPAGPGWDDRGFSWLDAKDRCARLTADGTRLDRDPQGIWRLPTVDEVVRTLAYRGKNAGGTWDAARHEARYRVMPDKEAPLWNRYSKVIYWWTVDELDAGHAYHVAYNGYVVAASKSSRPGYLACRCVK